MDVNGVQCGETRYVTKNDCEFDTEHVVSCPDSIKRPRPIGGGPQGDAAADPARAPMDAPLHRLELGWRRCPPAFLGLETSSVVSTRKN